MRVQGQMAPNAAPFGSEAFDISSRNKTTAFVDWQPSDWNVQGVVKYTADLSPIVSEIVNQPAWVSGNAIVITFSHQDGFGTRTAISYDLYGSGAGAPQLVLTSMPSSSEHLLAFDAADTEECDVEFALEHKNSYEGINTCATTSDLSFGRPSFAASRGGDHCIPVHVEVLSAGASDGSKAKINVNGKPALISSRGINVAVLDSTSHAVKATDVFDTYMSTPESERFAAFVNRVTPGDIILVAVNYDGGRMQEPVAEEALLNLGASTGELKSYESFAMIATTAYSIVGSKGSGSAAVDAAKASVIEQRADRWRSPGRQGVTIEKVFGCGDLGSHGNAENELDWEWMLNVQRTGSFDPMQPASGAAVDHDPESYMFSAGAGDLSWEVDMGGMKAVSSVGIGFTYPPVKMALFTSSDKAAWELVYQTDSVGASGTQTVLFEAEPKAGRYLRMFLAGAQKEWVEMSDSSVLKCDGGPAKWGLARTSPCHPCSWAAAAIRGQDESDAAWAGRANRALGCGAAGTSVVSAESLGPVEAFILHGI